MCNTHKVIDFPVSPAWAGHYIRQGYDVPEDMVVRRPPDPDQIAFSGACPGCVQRDHELDSLRKAIDRLYRMVKELNVKQDELAANQRQQGADADKRPMAFPAKQNKKQGVEI